MNKSTNRPLGTNEKVFWVLDQITTTHFAVVAELDGNLTENAWRQALDIVQQRHPNLSVQISGNEYATVHFNHVEECRIPLSVVWTQDNENWNSVLEDGLSMPIDTTIAPLVRAVLVQQPGKSVFMFISNHSIGDGMSVALVIRDILTVLAGKKVENLLPLSALDELAGAALNEIEWDKPAGFEQAKNNLKPRLNVNVDRLKLSSTLTQKLIARAKVEKTTVHGALGAVIVLALKSKNEIALQDKPVRILHPLSARSTLGLGDDFKLLNSIVTLAYQPTPQQTFWDFARAVREGIAPTQNPDWIKADIIATQGLFNNGMDITAVGDALRQGTGHEVLLTNLGLINFNTDFGDLQLKSLWGPMVLTAHPLAQTIGVATFNGELTLSLTGLVPAQSLLAGVLEIIEKVCSTEQDLQTGRFY
jgi:hypothetical protein